MSTRSVCGDAIYNAFSSALLVSRTVSVNMRVMMSFGSVDILEEVVQSMLFSGACAWMLVDWKSVNRGLGLVTKKEIASNTPTAVRRMTQLSHFNSGQHSQSHHTTLTASAREYKSPETSASYSVKLDSHRTHQLLLIKPTTLYL